MMPTIAARPNGVFCVVDMTAPWRGFETGARSSRALRLLSMIREHASAVIKYLVSERDVLWGRPSGLRPQRRRELFAVQERHSLSCSNSTSATQALTRAGS